MNREVHTASFVNITPDAEKHMAYCARVSNPSNQNNHDTAPRLLRYCIKHKHWSIFETASMQVEIETTRAIAAQILRHRSFSFQEYSQRYSSVGDLPPIGLPHLRTQDLKNKQASHDDLDEDTKRHLEIEIDRLYKSSQDLYDYALSKGVAKECARSILPLGTPTRMYQSGTIRSFIHYVEVRAGIETQLEHRLIAQDIKRIFIEQLPTVAEALEWTHDH